MCARRSNNDAICVDHIAMQQDNDAISISQPINIKLVSSQLQISLKSMGNVDS